MDSIKNLSTMGSMAVHTLRNGSMTERLILGSALIGAGIFVAHRIYKLAARFFSQSQQAVALNNIPVNEQVLRDYERRLQEQFRDPAVPAPVQQNLPVAPPLPPSEPLAHSLLASLTVLDQPLKEELLSQLGEALYAYQTLRTEIGGDEERFVFFTEAYLSPASLEKELKWEARSVQFDIPPHLKEDFHKLSQKLGRVGIKLDQVKRSDQPFAKAQFTNNTSEDFYDLGQLYKTIKLLGPHILSPVEIRKKKEQIEEGKQRLHKTRLEIIDKILSTLREVLIKELLTSFPEKQKELYPLFGNNLDNLRFVTENICWHALDRALESVEITFVPTEEKQQSLRRVDLETLLTKGLPEGEKRKQAHLILLEILKNPNSKEAIGSLVQLLISEKEANPEREALIKKVQEPKLQLEEEQIQQELGRLEAVQKFYTTVSFAAGVVDQGKDALRKKKEEGETKKDIIVRAISHPPAPRVPINSNEKRYTQEIDKVSTTVVQAGERAVRIVVNQRWESALSSINQELGKIPEITRQTVNDIIEQGWTGFADKRILMALTGHQRWLITQAMIHRKLATNSLENKGSELLHEVGKWTISFVNTLYSRFVTALLVFEQRTHEATPQDKKPADRIADALIDPLVKSYEALQRVKKAHPKAGEREAAIVKTLERNDEMHPSATKARSADAVFLGKLILELLSILQPEGLSSDIHQVLVKALSQPGELEPTLLRKTIERYNTIRPGVEPWIKLVGTFLFKALENIIERQSASNFATQISDRLDPVNMNRYLVDLLKQDASEVHFSEPKKGGHKDRYKWYKDDDTNLQKSLTNRAELKEKIEICKTELQNLKKANKSIEAISEELISLKKEAARRDIELIPELLRRIVIANVPSSFTGYVMQFLEDLLELMQYPQILRNIVFQVLEKTVQSLGQPLEEGHANAVLDAPMDQTANQPVADFLFSDTLKTSFGNKILQIIWSMSPKENTWSPWALMAQTVAKTVVPGHYVFSTIQKKIEELVQKKFKDPEAISWSVAKLVLTMNAEIISFAEKPTDEGMTALIAIQLNKAFEGKS